MSKGMWGQKLTVERDVLFKMLILFIEICQPRPKIKKEEKSITPKIGHVLSFSGVCNK